MGDVLTLGSAVDLTDVAQLALLAAEDERGAARHRPTPLHQVDHSSDELDHRSPPWSRVECRS